MASRPQPMSPVALPFFGLLAMLLASAAMAAPCPWDATVACSPGAMSFQKCTRALAESVFCGPAMTNGNATACNPTTPAGLTALMASQPVTANRASAFCSWDCNFPNTTGDTANCRIRLSDGLPVELMEFSIDDDPSADGDDQDTGASGEKESDGRESD